MRGRLDWRRGHRPLCGPSTPAGLPSCRFGLLLDPRSVASRSTASRCRWARARSICSSCWSSGAGRLVSKNELLTLVLVGPGRRRTTARVQISALRKLLGRALATIPGGIPLRGCRWRGGDIARRQDRLRSSSAPPTPIPPSACPNNLPLARLPSLYGRGSDLDALGVAARNGTPWSRSRAGRHRQDAARASGRREARLHDGGGLRGRGLVGRLAPRRGARPSSPVPWRGR